MTATSSTSAGTKFAISAAAPATMDATGFAALTYTTVKGVESIPAFGATTAVNNFQPLDGPQEKHKGPTNNGALALPYAYNAADAGQILLRTAAAPSNNAEYSCKIILPEGSVSYVRGRIFGNTLTVGSATGVLMGNSTLELNYEPVNVPAS